MKRLIVSLSVFVLLVGATAVAAAPTPSQLGGGVVINEVLFNPNGSTYKFDTDGNGTASATDEFVELYNLSASPVDISGWQLWDPGTAGNWFTFPGTADDGTTVLAGNAYAVVVMNVDTGGSLPTMSNPASLAFSVGRGSAVINNDGDNVVLYDPGADEYIQLYFGTSAAVNPPSYVNFSSTATLVGSSEDWADSSDGISLTRSPAGDMNVVAHTSASPKGAYASPTAVASIRLAAQGGGTPAAVPVVVLFMALLTAAAGWQQRRNQ